MPYPQRIPACRAAQQHQRSFVESGGNAFKKQNVAVKIVRGGISVHTYEQMPEKPGISQIIQLISITACAILKELPAYRFHSGYSFNSARLHFFSLSARAWHVPTSEASFRFPRRGRPESPRPRHVPEKMRFRHGASPGRNDRVRYPRASLVS